MASQDTHQKTYHKVNYRLRIAKGVERKMLSEVVRRLAAFGKLDEDYQYVGFGSLYFSDFALLHKALGIETMTSIELHEDDKDRFLFNRPYACINILFGDSNTCLTEVDWKKRAIVWLDYDGHLDESAIIDLHYLVSVLPSGSLLVVSVNCHPDTVPEGQNVKRYRYDRLVTRVGAARVPAWAEDVNLGKNGVLGTVYHEIVVNEIGSAIAARNSGTVKTGQLHFSQLLHFRYQDNAKMLTVGGLLVSEEERPLQALCGFERLPFIVSSSDGAPFQIPTPFLTPKEILHLEAVLPVASVPGTLQNCLPCVSEEDVTAFAQIYRFFPNFAELE